MSGSERVYFVHVMKTAGTSIDRSLRAGFPPERCYPHGSGQPWGRKADIDSLLTMPDEERSRIDYFAPHMPAWVADAVAPGHLRVTVLRDPIERTISHLRQLASFDALPDDLEALFAHPAVGGRLANYQTRLFADSATIHAAETERLDGRAVDFAGRLDDLSAALGTVIRLPRSLTAGDLVAARERLSAFDVVGVTEDLPAFYAAVERRTPFTLGGIPHVNRTRRTLEVSATLRRSIEEANQMDAELHEFARTLADESSGSGADGAPERGDGQ